MIHSMSGGKLGENKFVNFAKVEFDCLKGEYLWFLSEIELNENDKVLAPFGKLDELKSATVKRFDKNINPKMAPFNVKVMKYIFKKL